jgi:hypothetical protein
VRLNCAKAGEQELPAAITELGRLFCGAL